jgi:hypothetical protein
VKVLAYGFFLFGFMKMQIVCIYISICHCLVVCHSFNAFVNAFVLVRTRLRGVMDIQLNSKRMLLLLAYCDADLPVAMTLLLKCLMRLFSVEWLINGLVGRI